MTLLWSDHGTNFVGAKCLLKELYEVLKESQTNQVIPDFCSTQRIQWDFILEHAPHFGGLWESAVKTFKTHLHRIIGNSRLNFEELATVLSQIDACLNSRPLGVIPHYNDEGLDVLTPSRFSIGRPIEAIPDSDLSYRPLSTLRCWHLCKAMVHHFWNRWQLDYLTCLRRYSKFFELSSHILDCIYERSWARQKGILSKIKSAVIKLTILPVPSYFDFCNVLYSIWVCPGHPYLYSLPTL